MEEYLEFYNGEGVQHMAMSTNNIVQTVTQLQDRGVEFFKSAIFLIMRILRGRVGEIDENLRRSGDLDILVDRDEEGYLLQIFTEPVEDRPTHFLRSSSARTKSFWKRKFQGTV